MTTRTEYDADFESLGGDTLSALERPEEATKATAAVLTADTVERKPRISLPADNTLRLERGIREDGARWVDAVVRELTGVDEEALARAGTNWPEFLRVLVDRGTESIGGRPMTRDMAGELLIGDREALILAVRKVTFGNEIEFSDFICPYCGESTELTVDLNDIPYRHLDPSHDGDEYVVDLRRGVQATVVLPRAADQDVVLGNQDLTAAEQNTLMLSRCVRSISSAVVGRLDVTTELVRDLGWADRKTILQFLDDTQPGPRYSEMSFTHEPCGREVPLPVSVAALFL